MNISTNLETITPGVALAILANNPRNRALRTINLASIETEIRNGAWTINGEAIKIAEDGTLLDGQHRLQAVINTGIPIQTFVVRGLPADSQATMDTGSTRSVSDVLKINGEPNWTAAAAIARGVAYARKASSLDEAFTQSWQMSNVSRSVVLDAYYTHKSWIQEHVGLNVKLVRFTKIKGANMAALLLQLLENAPEDAEFFFDRLLDGQGLTDQDSIYHLRRFFTELDQRTARSVTQRSKAATFIKGWNRFIMGGPASPASIRFRSGGAHPESFPEPIFPDNDL